MPQRAAGNATFKVIAARPLPVSGGDGQGGGRGERIRVGLVGVGNCFSGLIQGIEYYRRNPSQSVIGIIHERLRGYTIHDIDFVCGFDVGENKVGKEVNEAIYESPNMVDWVPREQMPKTGALVHEAPQLDGVGIWVQNKVNPVRQTRTDEELAEDVRRVVRETGAEIIVSYLPVGSDEATRFWAQVCLDTGAAFVNCIPSFIASDPEWAGRFAEKGIPVVGDDIKGQVGATIVHRTLARLCSERGTSIERTYQINVGGNTDFLNMKEQERLASKRISKTESVQSQLSERLEDDQIYVGPSDFVPFLGNTKLMFMRIEGRQWANVPYNMEVRLDVDDKANSAGIVIDAVRLARIALDDGVGGPIVPASAYLMKHPPEQMSDPDAKRACEDFVEGRRGSRPE